MKQTTFKQGLVHPMATPVKRKVKAKHYTRSNVKYVVVATTRDSSPESVEMEWTRQIVDDVATAEKLCIARNRAELAVNGGHVWGYYAYDPDQE